MTVGRKIAVVMNSVWWRRHASIDFDGYCHQLLALGHSPILVCHTSDSPDQDFPVVEAEAVEMEKEQFWRSLGIEAAIFFNWLRAPRILTAMKRAGLFVISRGDSDGQISARVFPKAAWLALENGNDGLLGWLQKRQWWLRRCLILCAINDRDLLDTVQQTDTVVTECDESAKHLRQIFAYYKRPELDQKLHVVPHSVSDEVLCQDIQIDQKPRALICGGRWDDPQKDVHLLVATLERLLPKQKDLKVTIVGGGADSLFEPLSRRFPQINWLRRVARREMAQLVANSRIILSSSRWEGYSIITLEALCMGCTLVAPPLPGFVSMAEQGRYGTISPNRSPASLAAALEQELQLWDRGARLPAEISTVWRHRTNNHAVVSELISLIP